METGPGETMGVEMFGDLELSGNLSHGLHTFGTQIPATGNTILNHSLALDVQFPSALRMHH